MFTSLRASPRNEGESLTATYGQIRYKLLAPNETVRFSDASLVFVSASFNILGDSQGRVNSVVTIKDLHGNSLDPIVLTSPTSLSFGLQNFQSIDFADSSYDYNIIAVWKFITAENQAEALQFQAQSSFSLVPSTVGVSATIPLQTPVTTSTPPTFGTPVTGTGTTAAAATYASITVAIATAGTYIILATFTPTGTQALYNVAAKTCSLTFDAGASFTALANIGSTAVATTTLEEIIDIYYGSFSTTGNHTVNFVSSATAAIAGRTVKLYCMPYALGTSPIDLGGAVSNTIGNGVVGCVALGNQSTLFITACPDISAINVVFTIQPYTAWPNVGGIQGFATGAGMVAGIKATIYDSTKTSQGVTGAGVALTEGGSQTSTSVVLSGIFIPNGSFYIAITTAPTETVPPYNSLFITYQSSAVLKA
jgi:hypothetical protein